MDPLDIQIANPIAITADDGSIRTSRNINSGNRRGLFTIEEEINKCQTHDGSEFERATEKNAYRATSILVEGVDQRYGTPVQKIKVPPEATFDQCCQSSIGSGKAISGPEHIELSVDTKSTKSEKVDDEASSQQKECKNVDFGNPDDVIEGSGQQLEAHLS